MIITINLRGTIGENTFAGIKSQLDASLRNKNVKGVILEINSGGGSASASELIYEAVSHLNENKPVFSVVTGTAASGAYMIACATRKIYSIHTGLIGSVGVISMSPDVSELLDKIGVKVNVLSKGREKASMNPFQKSTEEDLLRQNVILSEIYDFFMTIVKERRHLSDEQASEVGNSGIYAAKEAEKLSLIDQVDSYGKIIESIKNELGEKSDPVVMKRKIPFLLRFAMKFLGQ
ncbi:MAG: S49 family peptidase [Candidatus Thermoplasmatota archaeon]|jgi:protease-4|nr:MAG: hypothetical protein AMDU5_GPLC00003G0073 [Thermoplasmatales archaeon Gpl]MCI2412005.1 S49 family peptidase [Cuniculiplasma sp.]MCL6015455.1 S49 family peptidase [Candidatus Thermoplasmatota archaeon]WMT49533.1 MAG: S49 family peptidase [Thermoplasmatales archaeon]